MHRNSLSLALSFRGGSLLEPNPSDIFINGEQVVHNYLGPSIAYFNNLRVPAAVLSSIVIKDMFALQQSPTKRMQEWDDAHGVTEGRSWRILRYVYLLLMVLAFALETNTIFMATQVSTQLSTQLSMATDNSEATSLVGFLVRHFEFEYTTVRCHFIVGILSYILAQALRVRYALRKYTLLSISGMCCLLTAASGMLTYTNAHTITYGGFTMLLRRNIELSIRFLRANMARGPMSTVTVVCFLLTAIFALVGWSSPEFANFSEAAEAHTESAQK